MSEEKVDVFNPSPQLLIALGSLVIHYEELLSPTGHPMDKTAIDSIRNQLNVAAWFDAMSKQSFLPLKR